MGPEQGCDQVNMRKIRAAYNPTRSTGFTLVELIVVASIVAFMVGLLLNRMALHQEQAEKVAMEQTAGAIRSALHLQFASRAARDELSEVREIETRNPMDWLAQKPSNYLGEYFAPKQRNLANGNWYFDLQKRNLIYLPRIKTHFHGEGKDGASIRFRVKVVATQKDGKELIEGVALEQVAPYTWF
jgi:type II secretory pathway pseudopilin PulG